MLLRIAQNNDMSAIAEVNIAAVPNGTRAKWGIAVTARLFECFFSEGGPFVVAEEDGQVVGYVAGFYKGSTAGDTFNQEKGFVPAKVSDALVTAQSKYDVVLMSLAVHPQYAGHGIAKQLVALFLKQ